MDKYFRLTIDSHMIFVHNWDEKILAKWVSIENPRATISICPKSTKTLTDYGVYDLV